MSRSKLMFVRAVKLTR